jgi:hypothetical protein
MKYTVSQVHRAASRSSAALPARSPLHIMRTPSASDAAYTSVSVALIHADDIAPAHTAAANAIAELPFARCTSCAVTNAATAVATAEKRFDATANGRKNNALLQTFTRNT